MDRARSRADRSKVRVHRAARVDSRAVKAASKAAKADRVAECKVRDVKARAVPRAERAAAAVADLVANRAYDHLNN